MPVTSEMSTDLVSALRSGGFASELRFAVCPTTVIWQATVNQTISANSYISFLWDNSLAGTRTNTVVGMTFMITATADPLELRNPLLRGRVTQAPTTTTFYCNEAGINLTDGMIVTVLSTFEVLQKDRIGELVDGFQFYENLSPIVKNMQSFYYSEDDTSASFSFAPTGQAMAEGASIASYAWVIAGASYTSGSASTQNITVTVPYGHTWAYLTITDSNGVALRFIFEILVCLRDDPAFMYMAHDNVSINGNIETGWNVTTSFFAGVTDLLNRTRCAIVAFDLPKSGAASLFNNVVFVGYIVQETTDITGDAISATLSQTSFELQSFAAIAAQLPVPSLPIRNDATPAAWGEMNLPTTQRTISYLLTRYSTLANLCAIDMLFSDATWFAGEMNLEAGTLLDSVNRIGDEINARLVFWPQGDATLEINGNFLSETDRDALPTLLASGNIEARDVYSYSLPVPYYKTVGQVQAGCATFYADGSTPVKLRAIAPATARQEGSEQPVVMAQLLEADLSQTNAVSAAKQRVGDLLEYLNPPVNLPTVFLDGWRILTPSTRVWLTYDMPATDSTRGLAVVPTERYWLQGVSLVWRVEGYWDVSGTPRLETRGGLAQQGATISPNQIDTSTPVLPILSDYDAYPPDGSINYDTTSPLDIDQQPFDPFDLGEYEPMTTEDAANAADNTPVGQCVVINPSVKFNSNVSRTTPQITQLGQTYTAYLKGVARLLSAYPGCFSLTSSAGPWNPAPFGEFDGGLGPEEVSPGVWSFTWSRTQDVSGDGFIIDEVRFQFNEPFSNARVTMGILGPAVVNTDANNMIIMNEASHPTLFPFNTVSPNGAINVRGNAVNAIIPSSSLRMTSYCMFEAGSESSIFADALYIFKRDDAGAPYDVELNPDGGLLFNGAAVGAPPLFSENHEYEVQFTGIGSAYPFVFYSPTYTDIQNVPLPITVCGPGLGS